MGVFLEKLSPYWRGGLIILYLYSAKPILLPMKGWRLIQN